MSGAMNRSPSVISLNHSCPSCDGSMRVASLRCESCDLELKGPIASNEFAFLNEDELHLLRIFMRSEGRVRDMEAPLGLSYPTIRTRIAELNDKLRSMQSFVSQNARRSKAPMEILQILKKLECKEISVEESINLISEIKKGHRNEHRDA